MKEYLVILGKRRDNNNPINKKNIMGNMANYSDRVKLVFHRGVTPYWKRWGAALFCSIFITVLFVSLHWDKIALGYGSSGSLLTFILILALFYTTISVMPFSIGLRHFGLLRLKDRDVFLLSAIVILYACIAFWLAHIQFKVYGEGFSLNRTFFFGNELDLLTLVIPITAAPMIVTTFFNVSLGYLFSFTLCFVVAFLCRGGLWTFIYLFLSSILSVHLLHPYHDRMKPIRTGFWIGIFQATFVALSLLIFTGADWSFLFSHIAASLISGLFSGVLASGFIPLVEHLFNYTTDMRLMELASINHPLLRELMIQAPGTYHHSLIVGTMAEAAANSIGANGLLAKVAAYYHDIGKIKKPLYFIENQFSSENRHEKLAPSMSSLILISHVKDGVELAKQYKLGQQIIDIIQQHHGTNLISYFYNKALELRSKTKQSKKGIEPPPVNIEDYRYPGPKPQTKEAGLVMLADIAEAACRSLSNPTPARIQGMVSKIINQAFTDGQLDNCELTLKDLHQIAKHFYQILAAIHHKRIEYPQQQQGLDTKKDATNERGDDSKRTATTGNQPPEIGKVSQPYLRRLGL
ncbi:MAG: HDIG domain-containing protein [Syntrophobacterales bacterium]|nr:HDIG domain-containing protein [Syntrophobacterales bacterium]